MIILVVVIGTLTIIMGAVGLVAPGRLLEFGSSLQTTAGLYAIGVFRVLFGVLLIAAARSSRAPVALRILGVLLVLAGVATALFGLEYSRALIDWWQTHGYATLRAGSFIAFAFGVFLILAIRPRRSV